MEYVVNKARILLGYAFFSSFILIVLIFWSGRKNHVGKIMPTSYKDFDFHVGMCRMTTWVRKTVYLYGETLNMETKDLIKPHQRDTKTSGNQLDSHKLVILSLLHLLTTSIEIYIIWYISSKKRSTAILTSPKLKLLT